MSGAADTWGINIATLTEADRFQVFEFRDPETGVTALVDLRNWNPSYCFVALPGTNTGGPTKPETLRRVSPQPLAFWVIYHNPADYPGKWVTRRQRVLGYEIVRDFHAKAVVDSLEDARAVIPPGLLNTGRQPGDDPVIYEVWM